MKLFCTLAAFAVVATPALADDSSAMLGAGGIVLTRQADIRMAVEDLRLSPKAVNVHYEFINDGKSDVDTIVAFPLPDIDVQEFYYEPLGTTTDHTPNFMDFKLTVDGKPVDATAEERAVKDGRDVTAQVKAAGLPINIIGGELVKKLDAMPAAQRKALAAQGILEIDDGNEVHPHWIAQTKFWWKQHFPAGKTVTIEHRYQPVTGQTFFGAYSMQGEQGAYYDKNFCLDAPTKATLRARIAAVTKKHADSGDYLAQYTTEFVLKTANNWKGPIGRFHLTLDKLKPDNVLSLCWNGDLRKTGATTFEATRDNFAPSSDVKLLVLETPSPQ
ncbi:MAG TPA: DUF4424 family protein [Rhizomicrobium sp.]|nr:DUF4424 family protein [Rhizomicrobium sp.]